MRASMACSVVAAIAAGCFAAALPGPAQAEITIHEAEYEAGILVVAGETTHPNREVSLDGRYRDVADQVGAFRFRIRYLPDDCTIRLSDGEDRRTAFVRGCSIPNGVDLPPDLKGSKARD